MGNLHIILDSQFGDTGKGKIIDYLSKDKNYCFRFQGGSNAGHTIVVNDKKYFTHLLPSSVLNENCICVLGGGMVISLSDLFDEIELFEKLGISCRNRIKILSNAHLVLDMHKLIDYKQNKHLGTTCKGIGPCYSDKMQRIGLRVSDLMLSNAHVKNIIDKLYTYHGIEDAERQQNDLNNTFCHKNQIKDMIVDHAFVKSVFSNLDNNILIEGANGLMLDIDHGTYPFVTSSNCSIGGVFTGLGINPKDLANHKTEIVGVVKSYLTRVGTGPFPTEQSNHIGEFLLTTGEEYGVTTGRNRRCGWIDLVQLKYSCNINGYDVLNLTKLDILGQLDEVYVCTEYSNTPTGTKPIYVKFENWKHVQMNKCESWNDLHPNIKTYIIFIEEFLGIPVKYINTGKQRHELIIKPLVSKL
jgi:adenylosuccinate synthase